MYKEKFAVSYAPLFEHMSLCGFLELAKIGQHLINLKHCNLIHAPGESFRVNLIYGNTVELAL